MILAFSLGDRVVNHLARRCIKVSSASALGPDKNALHGQLSPAEKAGRDTLENNKHRTFLGRLAASLTLLPCRIDLPCWFEKGKLARGLSHAPLNSAFL